jgi:DNA replication protein DnaC
LADRERYYTAIRTEEEKKVEAIVKKLMTYPRYAEIDKRLRTIQIDEGKASAKGDKMKLAKLEQERNRLRMERNNILSNNGLEEEDITVKRRCLECNDTGWLEDGTICSCYKGG